MVYLPSTTQTIPGKHYFLNRPESVGAKSLIQHVYDWFAPEEIAVCTTLLTPNLNNDALIEEHRGDKTTWLNTFCDALNVPTPTLIFAYSDKLTKPQAAADLLKRHISSEDILIDDFNGNLRTWRNAGGTAIKWLNGLNDPNSWGEITASPETISDMLYMLVRLMRKEALKHYKPNH